MRNEAADIVQDHTDDLANSENNLKSKARAMGNAAWDATKSTYQKVQDKTVEYSRATDTAVRENPYVSVGIALGAGFLLGLLITRDSDD